MIPFLPVPMDLAELPVPWLLSAVEERFGSHVSICAEVMSQTSADRSDQRQCLLRTEAFGLQLGAVAHPQSRQEGDIECPVASVPQFRFCNVRVCDEMPPARRLRELLQHWERRHPHRPETAAVVKISAGLDCEAVSPLGSVVMPGSASFKPHTIA